MHTVILPPPTRRLQMNESIQLTIESLKTYGARFPHWAAAWSGGKDSTAMITLTIHLITSGQVPAPQSLTIFYADTRMELLPLQASALDIMDELREKGFPVQTVMAPMDLRFLVYMLGRGVPPPNNRTLRWCTRQIKVNPMVAAIRKLHGKHGDKLLMLTGVRQGESAIRDQRIVTSCSRDGGECGQGWYQQSLPSSACDTLAPIVHWRVCHVWEWLKHWAPSPDFGDWSTVLLADAYGGDEAEELNARTGCVGCPLATKDTALEALITSPRWAYLAPLQGLRPLFRELRLPHNRLRKMGGERRKNGVLCKNQQRMGPLTMEARRMALARILSIQAEVNHAAQAQGRPLVDILNEEEITRIDALIEANTWPKRWDGTEPRADAPLVPLEDILNGQEEA